MSEVTKKWKIRGDEIRGEIGDVYLFGDEFIGVYFFGKLSRGLKGWELVQNGDSEKLFKAPLSDLDVACAMVGAERVKRLKKRGKNRSA